ncbi:MAG: N-6 DNA methylase [Rubrivivax sp.]|nr:N-6 DNA methylase [Rubrivivax sp.]MDZ4053053.1 N-6 DNA methylase [Phenylobacterium sp.]
MQQPALAFGSQRDADVEAIHLATAIYTVAAECDALVADLAWPASGGLLLDPGAGNGALLVAAIRRLNPAPNDVAALAARVRGYEFHPGAADSARRHIATHLQVIGWRSDSARAAAARVVETRDFLLGPLPVGGVDTALANPPFLRFAGLPASYRAEFEAAVPAHARADLMYAYLERMAQAVRAGGEIAAILSDRVLFNEGASALRARIGSAFSVASIRRLDPASAFFRPKSRRRGTPPRIHPVAIVLKSGGGGRAMTAAPFRVDPLDDAQDGIRLGDLANIQLAPWIGPDGVFNVSDPAAFPHAELVPMVEPEDIDPRLDVIKETRRWAFVTRPDRPPHPSVLEHLDNQLHRMPPRGRRAIRWLPPETFAHRLPLAVPAILIPRIARRLRAIPLGPGLLPVGHNLIVASGERPEVIAGWLNHPAVQARALQIAPRLENGFHSFTTRWARDLRIPRAVVEG